MALARDTFHHGDLAAALVSAGLAMSRTGGADGIVLREATRHAGVTARAAYRHFADREALVRAVARAALAEMAHRIDVRQETAQGAMGMLRAVGEGYIRFALDEPGWFDVAFFAMTDMVGATDPDGHPARSPYGQLDDALSGLAAAGLLSPGRTADAALMCWSGVHGFATLTSRGPLRDVPRRLVLEQAERLVTDLVEAVTGGPPPAADP